MQRLSCRHIDSVGQRCDNESWAVAEILTTVAKSSISNLEDIISNEAIPIAFELGLPLELLRILNVLVSQFSNNITGMGVHGDHAHNLHTHAGSELALHHLNKICEQIHLLVKALSHVAFFKCTFDSLDPVDQVDEEGNLCRIILKPVLLIFLSETL